MYDLMVDNPFVTHSHTHTIVCRFFTHDKKGERVLLILLTCVDVKVSQQKHSSSQAPKRGFSLFFFFRFFPLSESEREGPPNPVVVVVVATAASSQLMKGQSLAHRFFSSGERGEGKKCSINNHQEDHCACM